MVNDAYIVSSGIYLPEKVLTNADLERMVDTSDEWIKTRTGIEQRRIAPADMPASVMAEGAARDALTNAKMDPQDLDGIIVATVSPDKFFPSTACRLQKLLGVHGYMAFDISAACAGFIYAIQVARSMLISGIYRNILLVGVDKLSYVTDWSDRSTCVLFGDGAGAIILSSQQPGISRILDVDLGADGRMDEILHLPAGGSYMPVSRETVDKGLHYIKMQGSEVFKHAVRSMVDTARRILERNKLQASDVKYLIPHQANLRIINAVAERLGINSEHVYVNVSKYGNMSTASSSVALHEVLNLGELEKKDKLISVAFGGGLVWGSCLMEVM